MTESDAARSLGLNREGRERRSALTVLAGIPPWAGGIIGTVLILVVWWLVSVTMFSTTGSVPLPWEVLAQLVRSLADPVYWNAIGVTGLAALQGYLWGSAIALLLAFVVLIVPPFEGMATQIAVVASCIPLTAVAPIITLMSPAGTRATSVFLAALSVIFTTVVGALLGLKAASQTQLDVVKVYGGSRLTQLLKVRLIAAVPSLIAALKIGAPAAFLGSVLGEYFLIGVDSGLGLLLLVAQATNAYVRLWTIALICGGTAGAAYFLIGLLGRLVTPWSAGDERTGGGF